MQGRVKLVLTDIDGVWTDGGMYYDEDGRETKRFNTMDSAGVRLLKLRGIEIGIITGERFGGVLHRARKLEIAHVRVGIVDKLTTARQMCSSLGVALEETAYVGDDVNDLDLLEAVGLSACPSSAPHYVQKRVNVVLHSSGGSGVFREFAEYILHLDGSLDAAVASWRKSLRANLESSS